MVQNKQDLGIRLAFRREGGMINAYMAKTETMDDATLLASCRVSLIAGRVDFWDRWKAVVTDMFKVALADVTGKQPADVDMPERRAPEHERAGHG